MAYGKGWKMSENRTDTFGTSNGRYFCHNSDNTKLKSLCMQSRFKAPLNIKFRGTDFHIIEFKIKNAKDRFFFFFLEQPLKAV